MRTVAGLQALSTPSPTWQMSGSGAGSLDLYGASPQTYKRIYDTQPNVRIPVDFLARNVAQLGLPVFRRVSDTDRVRLPDHELAQWLDHPNPATTRYRLVEDTVQDYLIYWHAYWLKIRSTPAMGLVRLPAGEMSFSGGLIPTAFIWTSLNGQRREFDASEIVHFGPLDGVSPLETLRRILAEEAAAGAYRQSLWGNAARIEGVIERPVTAPKWTSAQKTDWRRQWQEAYASGGSRPGAVSVLEDGMTFKPIGFSAKDSEFLAARKLTREECASQYHIPLPMVGILDHATYSNVREMRKMLYADCLGPMLEMFQAEIERQMLPDCADHDRIYCEFNIAEKLKGSFEEQAQSLSLAVGKPWMKPNEARALQNLPADDNPASDEIAAQQGGPAAPAAGDPPVPFKPTPKAGADAVDVSPVIQAHRTRQATRLAKLPIAERAAAFTADLDRWNRELAADLSALTGTTNEAYLAASVNDATLMHLELEALHG
ncbi:MAG TPA: phage portal protein [Gemmatimonadaceae bacterium]|nr:phage portal protein [Gemmatimonadaceae bacterium]